MNAVSRGMDQIRPVFAPSGACGVKILSRRIFRTLDKLLTYTRFPGVLLQPLGHLTARVVDFTCFRW